MTDAASLQHLATEFGTVGDEGGRTNQARQRSVETGRELVAGLDELWTSPDSAELEQQLRDYYARAATTGTSFSRGFQVFVELAADARRIATELADAEARELSWFERYGELARAVTTGVHDVVSEQDIAAHERARDEYHQAMRRHEEAQQQADALRRQWRERATEATQALDVAVGSIESVDLRLPELVDSRFVRGEAGRTEIRSLWALNVVTHVEGLSDAERPAVWSSLDATERAALIEQLPGWTHANYGESFTTRELRLFDEAVRAPVSTVTQRLHAGVGVTVLIFEANTEVSLESEVVTMTDGSVELSFQASQLTEAGVDLASVAGASVGAASDAWVTLRFDSVDEYEAFATSLQDAVLDPAEMARILADANSRYVEGFGASVGLQAELEVDVPLLVNAAVGGGATAYTDSASGETGVRLHSEYSVDASTPGGLGPSGHASAAVAASIFTTPQGRHFVRIEGNGMMLAGVGPRNGPVQGSAASGQSSEASMTLEIRPENEDRIDALVNGLVDRDGAAVTAALDDLYDASHLTFSQSTTSETQFGVTLDVGVAEASAGGSSLTQDTDFHLEKRPFDDPYIHRF